jgi:hypothetical protein
MGYTSRIEINEINGGILRDEYQGVVNDEGIWPWIDVSDLSRSGGRAVSNPDTINTTWPHILDRYDDFVFVCERLNIREVWRLIVAIRIEELLCLSSLDTNKRVSRDRKVRFKVLNLSDPSLSGGQTKGDPSHSLISSSGKGCFRKSHLLRLGADDGNGTTQDYG